MSILTRDELAKSGIVSGGSDPSGPNARGWNASSYDSTVGLIITKHGVHDKDSYLLPPRGIAWVVSSEDYQLPNDVTGITTLKTGWTKSGVLTLTSGIVDPGYRGPLSTAVINFSKTDFPIRRGQEFFRTVFFRHEPVKKLGRTVSRDEYIEQVLRDTSKASDTFLTFEDFGKEMQDKVFQLPRIAFWIAIGGLVVTLLALVIPPILSMGSEIVAKNAEIEVLKNRVSELEGVVRTVGDEISSAGRESEEVIRRIDELEAAIADASSGTVPDSN